MGFDVLRTDGSLKTSIGPSTFTLTTTGNIDDLDFANADLIRFNNASLATLRGLKAGSDGQRVTIASIGAGEVDLAHQNTNSQAANRLINWVTSGITPLAPPAGGSNGGTATYQYDATTARWILTHHQQGSWITPAYSGSDWHGAPSMTVTVDSGDVLSDRFLIQGKTFFYEFFINTLSISGTPNGTILRTVPNGYRISQTGDRTGLGGPMRANDNGTYKVGFVFTFNPSVTANPTDIFFTLLDLSNWSASTNNSQLFGNTAFEID